MSNSKISKDKLKNLLKDWAKSKKLVAPIVRANTFVYDYIGDGDEAVLDDKLPYKSAKEFFFPQVEKLMKFDKDGAVSEVKPEPTVVFGVKPCDAEALKLLTKVFYDGEYGGRIVDPFVKDHFDSTVLVAVGCVQAKSGCFCYQRGLDKTYTDFCDILLNVDGDDYTVEALSEKGKKLLADSGENLEVRDPNRKAENVSAAPLEFDVNIEETKYFDAPNWEKHIEICQACGTCTYVCPTCHCFEFRDVNQAGVTSRYRCWDSCMKPNFTMHASGHNPRNTKTERYRQRVLHKYLYLKRNTGLTACTGCGRCVRSCPAGMSIRNVAEKVAEEVKA